MTLHWWMHWFWITRPLPVILLVLFSTSQCIPIDFRDNPSWTDESLGEPHVLPYSVQIENKESSDTNSRIPRDAGEQLNLTTSHENNSSVRISKSFPSSPKVAVKKSELQNGREVNNTSNSSVGGSQISKNSSVLLNVSESESVKSGDVQSTTDPSQNDSQVLSEDMSLEKVGRAASRSIEDDDATQISSVAPVSKSRISGPLSAEPRAGLDAAAITGIVLGIVVFAGLAGAVSFVVYRRRYLNKPQTLNDKCSNPDSSGYIDDSTLRENSEEMYSLDNDSFLNSLEAMTIQNYWTDNQETCWRHTRP